MARLHEGDGVMAKACLLLPPGVGQRIRFIGNKDNRPGLGYVVSVTKVRKLNFSVYRVILDDGRDFPGISAGAFVFPGSEYKMIRARPADPAELMARMRRGEALRRSAEAGSL